MYIKLPVKFRMLEPGYYTVLDGPMTDPAEAIIKRRNISESSIIYKARGMGVAHYYIISTEPVSEVIVRDKINRSRCFTVRIALKKPLTIADPYTDVLAGEINGYQGVESVQWMDYRNWVIWVRIVMTDYNARGMLIHIIRAALDTVDISYKRISILDD